LRTDKLDRLRYLNQLKSLFSFEEDQKIIHSPGRTKENREKRP